MATRGSKVLRSLDRYFGVPILATLGMQRKRPFPSPASIRRIGLMKTAAVGDTLLLAGFADEIRRVYPDAAVVMITGADNVVAARLLPGLTDEHIAVSPGQPIAAIRALRRARLDLLVDFGSWPRFDALLTALSRARFRVGFRTAGQSRHHAFDRVVDHSNLVHERANYERLLAAIGILVQDPPRIVPPGRVSADRLPPRPYVVFHAWASGHLHEAREWPEARWSELAAWATARGWSVVLTGAPSEAPSNAALAAALRACDTRIVDAAGSYALDELADVLASSTVVVSVNTGVAHLAGLVGAPTVCLHGPTAVHRWGPLGPRVRAVASSLPDCGYLNLGHDYHGGRLDCMEGVSVANVIVAIDELLD
jgi:heptosyltransferase-3